MNKKLLKNNKVFQKYSDTISQINSLESSFINLSDDELRNTTLKLKKQYLEEQNLKNILPQAFACTREAGRRILGLRHFDVQLLGGLILNEGKIAEMRTGEGKTLVSTLPGYLNALTEKGVHLVTVNDYLANRDQLWMGQIHRSLGLNVGLVKENMDSKKRKLNYNADLTYITNSELGFDYLRDNMVFDIDDIVQRPFNYCIVDEIDSILIDEARTPLIISGEAKLNVNKYIIAQEIIKYLEVNRHFEIDEKARNIILTEDGTFQIEKLLNVPDLYNKKDPWIPFVINALKGATLFLKDIHYIVKNNEIIIVDEFTGRIMPGRRWSDGLHQAIEVKENVPIRSGNQTLASITYQNFFSLYPKLSGMTGTAKSATTEFEKIYNISVLEVPTAKQSIRKDLPDLIYKDELSKWKAIAKECFEINKIGQPILIGTTSVEKSEILSDLLTDYQLSHKILNAKPENVKKESEIIAQAGELSAITIATNMAGRGTDIILGGNLKFKIKKELYEYLTCLQQKKKKFYSKTTITELINKHHSEIVLPINNLINDLNFLTLKSTKLLKIINELEQKSISNIPYIKNIQQIFNFIYIKLKTNQEINNKKIKKFGGLYVIGTERHESRRIDDQLRGRCGRQGDPGLSRFFLSLDDKVLRIYGRDSLKNLMENQLINDTPLESPMLTKSLDISQKNIENRNYDARKYLFDYDDVLNKQRQIIFYERRTILENTSIRKIILAFGNQIIKDIIEEIDLVNIRTLNTTLERLFGTNLNLKYFLSKKNNFTKLEIEEYLRQQFWLTYELKEAEIETVEVGLIREIEKTTVLKYVDILWQEHLKNMSLLRDAVGWRGYGQRNPLFEYKDESYSLFLYLIKLIRQLAIYELLHIKPI